MPAPLRRRYVSGNAELCIRLPHSTLLATANVNVKEGPG